MSAFVNPDRTGPAGPLTGIKVLDLSAYIAGPYGCSLLADQGADVLKIEPPAGDNLRHYPSTLAAESRAFLGVNRSKRGAVLDLKDPADHARLLALAAEADVLTSWARRIEEWTEDLDLCDPCKRAVIARDRVAREQVWDELPSIFGLTVEGWAGSEDGGEASESETA